MKKILVILVLSSLSFAQYYGERTTEQNFEKSELYFNSYYLNPFGLSSFKNSTVGLVDDPFLNLYLNPANLPQMDNSDFHFYLDFRGDRTTSEVVDNYVSPNYYTNDLYYRPYYDRRWIANTRSEPEPTFSIGLLTYPIKEFTDKLFLGGTYQMIHRNEKFYTMPYGIYNSRYLYDSFGAKNEVASSIPVVDRYSAKDEMMNEGHLFSAFLGYRILDNLNAGVSLNGVTHSREGGYLSSNKDDYGNVDNYISENSESRTRNQDYHHLDFSGGLSYELTSNIIFGLKLGILNGKADQDYTSGNYYFYQYKEPNVTPEWSKSYSNSQTIQKWNQDGDVKYISLNFTRKLNNKEILGYYKYSSTEIDLTTSSDILDSSDYSSRYIYTYDNTIYTYQGNSLTKDIRHGAGTRENKKNEAGLFFRWKLTENNIVSVGFYYQSSKSDVLSSEPVYALRTSEHHSNSTNQNYNYNYTMSQLEQKHLEWHYTADYYTIQIPIMANIKLSEHFALMLAVNRVLEDWNITDVTTAYYTVRRRVENGVPKEETLFGERYTQPAQKITENKTDFITKLDVTVSPEFKISLLVDPEWEHDFRVAQWWLSFNASL